MTRLPLPVQKKLAASKLLESIENIFPTFVFCEVKTDINDDIFKIHLNHCTNKILSKVTFIERGQESH